MIKYNVAKTFSIQKILADKTISDHKARSFFLRTYPKHLNRVFTTEDIKDYHYHATILDIFDFDCEGFSFLRYLIDKGYLVEESIEYNLGDTFTNIRSGTDYKVVKTPEGYGMLNMTNFTLNACSVRATLSAYLNSWLFTDTNIYKYTPVGATR